MKKEIPEDKIDKEKENVLKFFDNAKEDLKKQFGVDNMSTMEALDLRKIVEQCVKQQERELELYKQKKISGGTIIDAHNEAAQRWLLELYGLNAKDIPYDYLVIDKTTDKNYKFSGYVWDIRIKNKRDKSPAAKALGKNMELNELRHDIEFKEGVPDYFKEYIRRLREKAHKP